MREIAVVVNNVEGLHARPASECVRKAKSFTCSVCLEKEGKRINAKSIIGVLTLGVVQGDKIKIITDGEEEEKAVESMAELLKQEFDTV